MKHGTYCSLSADCMQDDGHAGTCTPGEKAPAGQPEAGASEGAVEESATETSQATVGKIFLNGREVGEIRAIVFHMPPALKVIAGVDLADKPDGIALAPPALDAIFRRHEEVYNDDGDATVESVLAACATEAYTLGAAHARQGAPAEEAERVKVLQEARNAGYDEGFASGREQGQRDERARIAELVRERACEEARAQQDHEARAKDFDRQADRARFAAARHNEWRELLCDLHDLISKGEG